MTISKEKEIREDFRREYPDILDRNTIAPEDEIAEYWLKIRREAIAEERESLKEWAEEKKIGIEFRWDDKYTDNEKLDMRYNKAWNELIEHLTQE